MTKLNVPTYKIAEELEYTAFFAGSIGWLNGERSLVTYGWVIYHGVCKIAHGYGEISRGEVVSEREAQYRALIALLKDWKNLQLVEMLQVYGDNEIVIQQLAYGERDIKSARFKSLYDQVINLWPSRKSTIRVISQNENEIAYELSEVAYRISSSVKTEPWGHRWIHEKI